MKTLKLLWLMVRTIFSRQSQNTRVGYRKFTDKDRETILKFRNQKTVDDGLKEFVIDGITVRALNEKNAIRKAKKRKV